MPASNLGRLERILDYLNHAKVRATYGAVGEALGVPAQAVGAMLGKRRPQASWVVSAKTKEPTGYAESEMHPQLRSNPDVITSGSLLTRAVDELTGEGASGIFISYRRDNTGGYARAIVQDLKQKLGQGHPIFMDIDAIRPGADFVEAIEKAVGSCHVFVALIGDRWLTVTDEDGQPRLQNPQDFIRLEIATALERNIEVIPVLLRGARMPREDELPEPLKALTRRQALDVSNERWDHDIGRLVEAIESCSTAPSPALDHDETEGGIAEPPDSADVWTWNKPQYWIPAIGILLFALALAWYWYWSPMPDLDEFVQIEPGEFYMGSESDIDEKPVRRVIISKGFQLGKYEVTQELWEAVMGYNPSTFQGARSPVEQVSWVMVQDFLGKLNELNDGFEYRLPTEAEWEYAARAGTSEDWPRNLGDMAWYDDNSGGETHPVGRRKPNAWGLYDMHGNVWEWVHDWYGVDYYGSRPDPDTDPQGPNSGLYRASRGGSWNRSPGYCRSARRSGDKPGSRFNTLGFRLLRQAR